MVVSLRRAARRENEQEMSSRTKQDASTSHDERHWARGDASDCLIAEELWELGEE